MKTSDFINKTGQQIAESVPAQEVTQQEETLAEFCAESAEQLYNNILSEGSYQGTHYEVNYIDKSGKDRFSVVTAKSKEEAKEKFKAKHSGTYKRITSLRSTGHDVMKESNGDAVKAAFEEGYEFAKSSKGKGYSNPYSPDIQASQNQAYKQGFLKGRNEVSQRIVSKQDEIAEGTWALPDSRETASQFLDLLKKPIPLASASDVLYDVLGDDELFDRIADLKDLSKKDKIDPSTIDVRGVVIRRMKELLKQSPGWKNQDPKVISTLKSLLKVDESKLISEGIFDFFGPSAQEKAKAEFEARRAARLARESQPKPYDWSNGHYDVTPKRGTITEHVTKLAADYSDHSRSASKCSTCSMFRAPNGCTKVEGVINPNGICKFYSAKTNEGIMDIFKKKPHKYKYDAQGNYVPQIGDPVNVEGYGDMRGDVAYTEHHGGKIAVMLYPEDPTGKKVYRPLALAVEPSRVKPIQQVNEDASAGGTGAGAVATVVGGVGGKPGTGKPKKVGNMIRRNKPQFGKGIY